MHALLSSFLGILLSLNVFTMCEKVNTHVTEFFLLWVRMLYNVRNILGMIIKKKQHIWIVLAHKM